MSTNIFITGLQQLQKRLQEAADANRRAHMEKEARDVRLQVFASTPTSPINEPVRPIRSLLKGAGPTAQREQDKRRIGVTDTVSVGWLEQISTAVGSVFQTSYRPISGNGSVAADPVVVPLDPTITYSPDPYIVGWSSTWGDWSHFPGGFGSYFTSACWARFRNISQIDITEFSGWYGPAFEDELVLPDSTGLLWTHRHLVDRVRYHYTVRITPISPNQPRGVQLIPGTDVEDPDVLWAANPSQRRLLIQAQSAPSVIASPTVVTTEVAAVNNVYVGHTFVRDVDSPTGYEDLLKEILGELPARLPDEVQYNYTTNGNPAVYLRYTGLSNITVDGVSYGRVDHEVYLLESLTWKWPQVNIPARDTQKAFTNAALASAVQNGSIGPATIVTSFSLGEMFDIDQAGSFVLHRILRDYYDPLPPSPFSGITLEAVISNLQPLPAKFCLIEALGIGSGDFGSAGTTMTFPSYSAATSNLKAEATWFGFSGSGLPSAPGPQPTYSIPMVEPAGRVDTTGNVRILMAAHFTQSAYCRESMLLLGFTESELNPPPPPPPTP
jgi:hypothetical protein